MVPRLWVPDCHRLEARNWNLAASGAAFTASIVANSIDVSTPLRTGLSVMVMSLVLSGGVSGDGAVRSSSGGAVEAEGEGRRRGGGQWRKLGQPRRRRVEQPRQLLLR